MQYRGVRVFCASYIPIVAVVVTLLSCTQRWLKKKFVYLDKVYFNQIKIMYYCIEKTKEIEVADFMAYRYLPFILSLSG